MFYIGVDLGQKHDYTAIAIVEKENEQLLNLPLIYMARPAVPPRLLARRLERIALGTPYPAVVEHIRAIARQPPMAGHCALVVDATGLGAPVVDFLREPGTGCDITAVTITGGDRVSRHGPLHFAVPKRDLISGVQLALEKGQLRIARRLKDAGTLVSELKAMRAGRDSAGHDDLVLALALACWRAQRKSVWGAGRLPGI